MIYLIKTTDSDSDLFVLRTQVLPVFDNKKKHIYYCEKSGVFEQFLADSQVVSMFNEPKYYILYNLKLNKDEKKELQKIDEDIVLVNPSTKVWKELGSKLKVFDTKLTVHDIKRYVDKSLTDAGVKLDSVSQQKLLEKIATVDEIGALYYSPLIAETVAKQAILLATKGKTELEKFLYSSEKIVDHWQILSYLFAPLKERIDYFKHLESIMDIYEMLNSIKTTLLLATVVLEGDQQHIDSQSLARQIGKHPFYISNIQKTLKQKGITQQKTLHLLQRMLNLETKIKTGELDDPNLGFDILLATY
jgi:hypothetical protein